MKFETSIGVTVQAYARIRFEADSLEELRTKVGELLDDPDLEEFEIDWESVDQHRVLSTDRTHDDHLSYVPLEADDNGIPIKTDDPTAKIDAMQ